MQAAVILPDTDVVILRSEQVEATTAWGMPEDLPLPIAEANGVFVPATARDSDLIDWNPWQWAQVAKMQDDSRPKDGPHGEPSDPGKGGALVAEWGGMPYPVRDYQEPSLAGVVYSPRQVNYHQSHGPAGRFMGPQQTAWEAQAPTPVPDYWSTIILGAHQ